MLTHKDPHVSPTIWRNVKRNSYKMDLELTGGGRYKPHMLLLFWSNSPTTQFINLSRITQQPWETCVLKVKCTARPLSSDGPFDLPTVPSVTRILTSEHLSFTVFLEFLRNGFGSDFIYSELWLCDSCGTCQMLFSIAKGVFSTDAHADFSVNAYRS